jgi:hypothetical protein
LTSRKCSYNAISVSKKEDFMKISDKAKEFMADVIPELIENGIDVLLYKDSRTPDGYSGGFCSENMTFECAMGKEEKLAFSIFVHEYNHFRQWFEKDPLWIHGGDEILDYWLSPEWHENPTMTQEEALKYMIQTMKLELDCELRSVKMFKEYDLGIDIDWYIKCSNAYVYFYKVMFDERKWYVTAPYEVPEILDILPTTFLENPDDYWNNVPEEFVRLVKEKCFE